MNTTDPILNCSFPVSGDILPREHGYAFYGALHRFWPALESYDWLQIGPIAPLCRRGKQTFVGQEASLLIRAPLSRISLVFSLAETRHAIDQGSLVVGPPTISQLSPAPVLYSPFVTVKVHSSGDTFFPWDDLCLSRFITGIDARLAALGITTGRAHVDMHHPRWLQIKDGGASGYPVTVTGLSDTDSLLLQSIGLGGRRKMGCGVMTPWAAIVQK